MTDDLKKQEILKRLKSLNELERQKGSDALINTLAQQYDVSEEMVKKVIAEWSAGGKKL